MTNNKKMTYTFIILGLVGGLLVVVSLAGYRYYSGKSNSDREQKATEQREKITGTQEKLTSGQAELKNKAEEIIDSKLTEQFEKDSHYALIYQSEISHFFVKFRTCLHWTLPLGENIDIEIDSVFNYGRNLSSEFDLNKISKPIVEKIFSNYNFRNIMPNYVGEANFHPSGFSNLLGILTYLERQIGIHLSKYGATISSELTTKSEYLQRTILSTITSIRLDKQSSSTTTKQTIEQISGLLILMKDEINMLKERYTKNIEGGYPIVIGKVTKSHKTDGEIMVETQFSNY